MMIRVIAIVMNVLACGALWFSYMNLNVFRGTLLFEFRYVIFACGAFLGLSAFEWAIGWIKTKVQGKDADH